MPSLLIAITGIFTAAFISVSIFLMQDKSLQYFWDRDLILKEIIKAKELLVAISLMTFPVVFWNYVPILGNIIIITSYLFGVKLLWNSLFASYRWIRSIDKLGVNGKVSFRMQKRLEYLASPPDIEAKINAWESVFDTDKENKSVLEERRFMEKFIEFYDGASGDISEEQRSALFTALYQNIENISFEDMVIFEDMVEALLDWRHQIHFDIEGDRSHIRSKTTLDRLLKQLISLSFDKRMTFPFFQMKLREHIKHKSENYIIDLFVRVIITQIFENVEDSSESFEFWDYNFPSDWLVTVDFEERDELDEEISKLFFREYIRWAQRRITSANQEWDKDLENVSNGLFPGVNSNLFSILMSLMVRSYGESRMADLVEKRESFGLVGTLVSTYGGESDIHQKLEEKEVSEEEYTIDLMLKYFNGFFTVDQLEKYIRELQELSYEDDSAYNKKLEYLIRIFNKMIRKIKENEETKMM